MGEDENGGGDAKGVNVLSTKGDDATLDEKNNVTHSKASSNKTSSGAAKAANASLEAKDDGKAVKATKGSEVTRAGGKGGKGGKAVTETQGSTVVKAKEDDGKGVKETEGATTFKSGAGGKKVEGSTKIVMANDTQPTKPLTSNSTGSNQQEAEGTSKKKPSKAHREHQKGGSSGSAKKDSFNSKEKESEVTKPGGDGTKAQYNSGTGSKDGGSNNTAKFFNFTVTTTTLPPNVGVDEGGGGHGGDGGGAQSILIKVPETGIHRKRNHTDREEKEQTIRESLRHLRLPNIVSVTGVKTSPQVVGGGGGGRGRERRGKPPDSDAKNLFRKGTKSRPGAGVGAGDWEAQPIVDRRTKPGGGVRPNRTRIVPKVRTRQLLLNSSEGNRVSVATGVGLMESGITKVDKKGSDDKGSKKGRNALVNNAEESGGEAEAKSEIFLLL